MLETLIQGSWMMIFLVSCSVAALAVIIDRGVAFYQYAKVDTRSLRAKVLSCVREDRVVDAARLCLATPGPVSAVLLTGLQSYAKHRHYTTRSDGITVIMKEAMQDFAQHAVSAVERYLNILATVASAAPLFGMAGTVTGMIKSFDKIAGAGGMDASLVAGGISEALVTTAAGLLIALFAVIPYSFFTARADAISLEIDETTSELLDFVATKVERAN